MKRMLFWNWEITGDDACYCPTVNLIEECTGKYLSGAELQLGFRDEVDGWYSYINGYEKHQEELLEFIPVVVPEWDPDEKFLSYKGEPWPYQPYLGQLDEYVHDVESAAASKGYEIKGSIKDLLPKVTYCYSLLDALSKLPPAEWLEQMTALMKRFYCELKELE